MRLRSSIFIALGFLYAAVNANHIYASDLKPLDITVYDFPPDIVDSATNPSGSLVDTLNIILAEAGYKPNWLYTDMTDESRMLDISDQAFCTTGRIYSPERGRKWHFIPYEMVNISRDLLLIRRDRQHKFFHHNDLMKIVADRFLEGAFVKGGLYGPIINKALSENHDWLNQSATSDLQALLMVKDGKTDYAIVPMAIWASIVETRPEFETEIIDITDQIRRTQDKSEAIFLTCSLATPMEIVQSLSDAMGRLGFRLADRIIRTDVKPYIQRPE